LLSFFFFFHFLVAIPLSRLALEKYCKGRLTLFLYVVGSSSCYWKKLGYRDTLSPEA
jgi:hypothetical protein